MLEAFDIHCPACGPHRHNATSVPAGCPACGSARAIVLRHDGDIDKRFQLERESAARAGRLDG